jgi:hypothetical protein
VYFQNKEMFCFASTLVERGNFEIININFLIVGHTHCNLDQNFSVLSKKIQSSPYICSPLALIELLRTAHKEVAEQPRHIVQLHSVHDYVSYFAPVLNKSIHHYQVPHRFTLWRYAPTGRCVMQYQLFSPSDGEDNTWLPPVPKDESTAATPSDIRLPRLTVVNGTSCFLDALLLGSSSLAEASLEQLNTRKVCIQIY